MKRYIKEQSATKKLTALEAPDKEKDYVTQLENGQTVTPLAFDTNGNPMAVDIEGVRKYFWGKMRKIDQGPLAGKDLYFLYDGKAALKAKS